MDGMGTAMEMLAAAAVGGIVGASTGAALGPWWFAPLGGIAGAMAGFYVVGFWRM